MIVSEFDTQQSYEAGVFAPEMPDEAVDGGGWSVADEDEGFVGVEVGDDFGIGPRPRGRVVFRVRIFCSA